MFDSQYGIPEKLGPIKNEISTFLTLNIDYFNMWVLYTCRFLLYTKEMEKISELNTFQSR